MAYAALTFNPVCSPVAPPPWEAQQIDGETVGWLERRGQFLHVSMVDTLGNRVWIGTKATIPTAQRAMVKAWQLQLSKGGNP